MNGDKEFAQLLKSMEDEVLALKTAHQRPLGALNFFMDKIEFTINLVNQYGSYYREFYVEVKIAEPVATPPIMQTMFDVPPGVWMLDIQEYTVSSDFTTWTFKLLGMDTRPPYSGTMLVKFGALSSQPIESITWRYA